MPSTEVLSIISEAGWTGLEPAASGVTGRRYNQLNYHPIISKRVTSAPLRERLTVGETGLEPATLGL